MRAAIIEKFGSAEEIKIIDTELPSLKPGEVRLKHKAIGLNYIDVYYRKGIYKTALPSILGFEACGVIEDICGDCGNLKIGDRVAYATAPIGAYCEARNIPYQFLLPVPKQVTNQQAAAVIFKGMTAHYLLRRTFFVRPNIYILIHAAAGGMGHFLVQMAKHYQAKVIGTVSSDEKKKIAYNLGCDYVINYKQENISEKVKDFTKGEGVHVVYDAVGKDTFLESLASLGLFGLMVSYGQASGEVPAFDLRRLTEKSLFITRPTLFCYKNDIIELSLSAQEVFQMLINGAIKDNIKQIYKFNDIAQAHLDLENRKTTGSSVIIFD